jgi:hypothetical protein
MIFAEMDYQGKCQDFHAELLAFLSSHFSSLKYGLQGDSWFWIIVGEEKIAIDTFSSMKHQIKSERPGPHVQKVIKTLLLKYKLNVYEKPELEGHEYE